MIDTEMDQIIGTIVDSLFSVCVTLGINSKVYYSKTKMKYFISIGSVPIIRCPKGEAAEIVGEVCEILYFKIFIFNYFFLET